MERKRPREDRGFSSEEQGAELCRGFLSLTLRLRGKKPVLWRIKKKGRTCTRGHHPAVQRDKGAAGVSVLLDRHL